ncbi:response regulator transcription factor [Nonomuraea sp. NPDC050451]|uniref:response regulator transcription factor n=1 Tax=Nonomuraea sp. NPDC050451 TaxID=3364364 RepID=UPI0037AF0A77
MIRVLLADDQKLVRVGLRMLCESDPEIEVVGEAGDGREAVRLADESVPDVILMDLRMPGVDGITATERIMAARPSSRVVVLTTFDDDDHLYPALSAGAFGFLVKDSPPGELLAALHRDRGRRAAVQPLGAGTAGRAGRTRAGPRPGRPRRSPS